MKPLQDRSVLILGGTGSLGQRLFERTLTGEFGRPESITVFSRDEAKQHYMRLAMLHVPEGTDDVIYKDSLKQVHFVIGDVRSYEDLRLSVDRCDAIVHAAALKQVPTCEYFGAAAVNTNIMGAINLARAIREGTPRPRVVVGVSTDKACKPVNLMGMTKAIQERILSQANLDCPDARFVSVRYGNVMASRGSAIPFFMDLARQGKPIPITDVRMTRFCMTLDQAVDLIMDAYTDGGRGETWIPVVPTAKVVDIARAVTGQADYPLELIGVRPGEKIHEVLVSEEEASRTGRAGTRLVIGPILPELRQAPRASTSLPFDVEYTSEHGTLAYPDVVALLERSRLTLSTATERTVHEH